jgi:hypothetical protein
MHLGHVTKALSRMAMGAEVSYDSIIQPSGTGKQPAEGAIRHPDPRCSARS